MKKVKCIIFIIVSCVFAVWLSRVSEDSDLINIYYGTIFNSKIFYYMYLFMIFAGYSLFIYGEFKPYVYGYGIIIVTREKSRKKLLKRMAGRLLGNIVILELIKIISITITTLLIKKEIMISEPMVFAKMAVINIYVLFSILLFQMMIEIYFTSELALLISLSYYLVGIVASDFIYRSSLISKKISCIFIQNLSMKARLDSLVDGYMELFIIFGLLLCLIMLVYLFFKGKFQKKDLI